MKILIISDIHANQEALEALNESYDELWILGDIVNYGPSPREAIEFARAKATVVIRGNHDNAVGYNEDPRCSPRYREMARATSEFTAAVLSNDEIAYLASLPLTAVREIDGKRFFLCHATPSNPLYEYLGPNDPRWTAEAKSADGDVLLTGHTHLPLICHERGQMIVNPGSLGQPKLGEPVSSYAVWDGTRMELRSNPYPFEKTVEKLSSIGLPSGVLADLALVLRTGRNPI